MTGGPSSILSFSCFSCFLYFSQLEVWAQGDIWSSGIYLPDGYGFPYLFLSFFGFDFALGLLGLVFAFLSDFGLEESLPRSSLRLPTSGAG